MRLIDADELLSIVRSMTVVDKSVMHRILIQMPTVDAVEVVRCAVCRYFLCNMRGDGTLPNGVDEFECVLGRGGYDPMDFCSEGERKDGEHDRG